MATFISAAHPRVTSDYDICHRQPVVRGLRYPVWSVLELLASGMTDAEILADYEDLSKPADRNADKQKFRASYPLAAANDFLRRPATDRLTW